MDSFERAKELFLAGVRDYQGARFEEAQAKFEQSLSLVPQRPSTLMNLGATRIQLRRFDEAAQALGEATRLDPADAQAWGHLATALAELGKLDEALESAGQALRRDGTMAQVWSVQGMLLRDLQRPGEAVESFRSAIRHGADADLHNYYISALTGEATPAATPRRYVETLFDSYAGDFEDHLVQVLRYGAPAILMRGLPSARHARALDLGCGTGLMGDQLRPRADHLVGVDLSAAMVASARERGVYDEVVQADALDYLSSKPEPFDVVAAADVFNYIGDLAPVFAAVHGVLAPNGAFAFTVELAQDERGFALQPSLRYAHSRAYIQTLAIHAGFEVASMEEHPIRDDQQAPIAGLFAWLSKR